MEFDKKDDTIINKEEDDDVSLPGFRFHPTDEELVGFYLRRKVEKRPISIELIKQADIYKYDPWDLPKASGNVGGEKEWYFFCKRGRKYRNSVRPNRVTGSGFWKATGIDRPIYASSSTAGNRSNDQAAIGLKKSLVYYRGSAGKGTKTDWMMHEFRLPQSHDMKGTKSMDAKSSIANQEAEVWTLCRILKRNTSNKRIIPDWRESQAAKKNTFNNPTIDQYSSSNITCSMDSSDDYNMKQSSYITFNAPNIIKQNSYNDKIKPYFGYVENVTTNIHQEHFLGHFSSEVASQPPSTASSHSRSISGDINELLMRHAEWEDLRSIVDSTATVVAAANYPFYM